jgi:hypothetical protein
MAWFFVVKKSKEKEDLREETFVPNFPLLDMLLQSSIFFGFVPTRQCCDAVR